MASSATTRRRGIEHPPTGLKSSKRHRSFAPVFGPGLCGALDDLFGAEGWIQPKHAGQVLVTMPGATEWRVPHHLWHVDFQYTLPPERLAIVKCWALVDDLEPGGGATPQIAGSHRLVANFVAGRTGAELDFRRTRMAFMQSQPWLKALATDDDDPDRNERFMTETDVDGVPVHVVELTGAAGTVYITHPWVLHSLAPNTRETPRLMRSFPIRQERRTTSRTHGRDQQLCGGAAVGAGDDLEQVSVGIVEVDAAAAVFVVDLARLLLVRIGPMGEAPFGDPAEDRVEIVFAHQERVVLGPDVVTGVDERECDLVGSRHLDERTPSVRGRQAEDLGEELGRTLVVTRVHDRVIEANCHAFDCRTSRAGSCR